MKRIFACLVVVFATVSPVFGGLSEDIRAVLADKALQRVQVGVEIVRLESSSPPVTIYENKSDALFVPASNLKLITTAAALDKLGPEFRFRTYLVLHDGNVVVWGDGDPTTGDVEMLQKVGWNVDTVFKGWAEQLLKKNITSVDDVIVDDSVFDEVFLHPNWPADQVHKRYVAEVGGLNLNANCVDFLVQSNGPGRIVSYTINPDTRYVTVANTCVTGNQNAIWLSRMPQNNDVILRGETRQSLDVPVSVTIHDPPMFAATTLAETLARNGVAVGGTVKRDRTTRQQYAADQQAGGGDWTVLAVHETPIEMVLARANKDSMNLYAESLCKRLGHAATNESGSWANGTAAIGEFLRRVGVKEGQFNIDDGSGLSKQNFISPDTLVKVLAHVHSSPQSKMFLDSLAIAGQDGTLSDRFRGTDLGGRVFAKSGYVSGASSLSGYLQSSNGRWYAFSILMNGIPEGSNSMMKAFQERIVRAVDVNGR
jgi:D-alanyl-D-alanine carboxypeptidase/D-alanyl-D-alanine-endopeptidase (penicillin-binding protein 4)